MRRLVVSSMACVLAHFASPARANDKDSYWDGGYDQKATRLSAWLRSHHRYTLSMPKLDPRSPVLAFLRSESPGHCELFAASLVVLLRSLGR